MWEAMEMGVVDYDEVWEAYGEILRYGFEQAIKMAEQPPDGQLPRQTTAICLASGHGQFRSKSTAIRASFRYKEFVEVP